MTTPAEIIQDLISAYGLTEERIVDELKGLGITVTQATINRLKTGAHRTTRFETGTGLFQLHDRYSKGKRGRAAIRVPSASAA